MYTPISFSPLATFYVHQRFATTEITKIITMAAVVMPKRLSMSGDAAADVAGLLGVVEGAAVPVMAP